jgi:hypothetical protein
LEQSLISCTTRRLLKIKGFSDIKVEKIKEAAKKMAVCFSSALVLVTIVAVFGAGFGVVVRRKVANVKIAFGDGVYYCG